MQSDDLVWKLLSQSFIGNDEKSHPLSFHVIPQDVVDAISLRGFKTTWINSWQKIPLRALKQKKFHFWLGKSLSHKLLEAGEIPWGHSTRESALAVFPGQTLLMAFQDMLLGWMDPWSDSAQPILCSFPYFSGYHNTKMDQYYQCVIFSDSESKQQSCVHYNKEINTIN